MSAGLVELERKKFERAVDRAIKLGLLEYILHLERIIEELKAIEKLDKDFSETFEEERKDPEAGT